MLRLSSVFFCLLLNVQQVFAEDFSGFKNKLDLAEDYLVVSPSRSITILESLDNLDNAPPELFIRWHQIYARTAVYTSHYDQLHKSLEAIFKHHKTAYFQQNMTSIMSALGIWLRHAGYFNDAELAFECSYKYAKNDRQRLTLINSIAIVASLKGDYIKARNLYIDNHKIALDLNLSNVAALIESNLGYLALYEGNTADAESWLRKAFINYQKINKRAGQVSAGLNLLMVFLIQENVVNFERLHEPTSTLTHAFPNEAKKALLLWLEAGYKKLTGGYISRNEKEQLQVAYKQLESDKIKMLVHNHLAKKLEMSLDLPTTPTPKRFSSTWFNLVKTCNWEI